MHLYGLYSKLIENFSLKKSKVSQIASLTDRLQQCSKLSAILPNALEVILFANERGRFLDGLAPVNMFIATPEPIPAPQDP